jgi:hypothetical protein
VPNLSSDLKGLEEKIVVTNLFGGDKQTVQEQQLAQEQGLHQQQQQMQEHLKFSLQKGKDYISPKHDALEEDFVGSIDDTQYCEFLGMGGGCFWFSSAAGACKMLTRTSGLQGKSPFLWFVRKINGKYAFRLIDVMHYQALADIEPSARWDRKMQGCYNFTLAHDFVVKITDSTPLLKMHGNVEFPQDPQFWKALAEAKILSGCWAFPSLEEKEGLKRYLQSMQQSNPSTNLKEVCIRYRLGEGAAMASDYTKIAGWVDSDLYKAIQDVGL